MKEKTFFKIFTISLIIIFILMGLNLNAYANIYDGTNPEHPTANNTGTIRVSNIEAGLNVTAYQLTSVNYNYTEDQPQAIPYTWESGVKTWIDENYSSYSDPEDFYKDVKEDTEESKAKIKEFYSKLAAAIKGGTVTIAEANTETKQTTGTASYPVTAENLRSSVEFTNRAMGTYLILIENGYRVYSPSVINLTPTFNETEKVWELATEVEVEVKSTTPTISKTVDSKTADNYSTKDTMNFKIVANVPTYLEGSLAKNYMISDKVNGGLVIDKSSIRVFGQNGSSEPVQLAEDVDYTLVKTSATRQNTGISEAERSVDFLVNFTYDKLKGKYDKVIVEYTATLAKDDTIKFGSTDKNENIAYLDYSNNPYAPNSYQEQKSLNTIYTYGIEVTKVDKNEKDAEGNYTKPLPGAEFELLSGSDKLFFVKKADGVYYQTTSTDTEKTTTLVVDNNGKLNIKGLDAGTYTLKETKAPDGYNIATQGELVEIKDEDMNGNLDDEEGMTGICKLTFPNGQGFQLPITGGMGTMIFTACGIILFGIGAMLLLLAFKKNKANR